MFFPKKTSTSTKDYSAEIDRLKNEIETADAILIGAGAGLSTAAGFTYSGERFETYFADFIEKYGFRDMYSGGFYPFATWEEHWAYWSRYIHINRYLDADNGTYRRLFDLVKDKDYFVLTTNVDHQFQKAGFDKHFSSAPNRAVRKPMTMRRAFRRCWNSSRICAFQRN